MRYLLNYLAIAVLCCFTFPSKSQAVTLDLSGTIFGITDRFENNFSTLDYYFISVPVTTSLGVILGVDAFPAVVGTGLDLGFYTLPPDVDNNLTPYAVVLNSTSGSFQIDAGRYLLAFRPRDSDFDGYWPLPAVEVNGATFNRFNYQATLTGEIQLDEIWIGQRDGTFKITVVPEPTAASFLLVAFGFACLRTRWRHLPRLVVMYPLLLALTVFSTGTGQAQTSMGIISSSSDLRNGVLTFPTLRGMGYRIQRSEETAGFLGLPERMVGAGNITAFKAYDLPEFAQAPYVAPSGPQVPRYYFVGYPDLMGKCAVRMLHRWSQGEVLEMDLSIPQQPGRVYRHEVAVPVKDAGGNTLYVLDFWVLGYPSPNSTTEVPLPLTRPVDIDAMAKLKTNKQAVLAALTAPVPYAPPGPPVIAKKFDEKGRPLRQFFRVKQYLIDSDGDGYSDYTEYLGGSSPQSGTALPLDSDGDGFSDAEEMLTGTDKFAAASHPPGGFLTPYQGNNGPVITEILTDNKTTL